MPAMTLWQGDAAGAPGNRDALRRGGRDDRRSTPRRPLPTTPSRLGRRSRRRHRRAPSAGASLMPSPTMIVEPCRPAAVTASTFSAGVRSASTSSTPITAPTDSATSARSPVTITTRRMPLAAQRPDGAGGVGAERVVEHDRAGRLAVELDEHRQGPVEIRPATHCPHPRGGGPSGRIQPALPTATSWPSTRPRTPCAGTSSTSSGSVELEAPLARGTHHRRRQHVRRHLLQGRCRTQQLARCACRPR